MILDSGLLFWATLYMNGSAVSVRNRYGKLDYETTRQVNKYEFINLSGTGSRVVQLFNFGEGGGSSTDQ